MFLLRTIIWLVSLPICWAGWGLSMFKSPLCVPLLRAGWRIGGAAEVECRAIHMIQTTAGPELALAEAVWAMGVRPSPQIAATAGLLANMLGDAATVAEMLARGRALGDDPQGRLDLLEYVVRWPDRGEFEAYVDSLAQRRDLNPLLTRMVAICLAWREVADKQLALARRRVHRILQIEDLPDAHMVLWAAALQEGNAEAAAVHLGLAERMPPELRTFYEIQGRAYAGDLVGASQLVHELLPRNPALAQRAGLYLREAELEAMA